MKIVDALKWQGKSCLIMFVCICIWSFEERHPVELMFLGLQHIDRCATRFRTFTSTGRLSSRLVALIRLVVVRTGFGGSIQFHPFDHSPRKGMPRNNSIVPEAWLVLGFVSCTCLRSVAMMNQGGWQWSSLHLQLRLPWNKHPVRAKGSPSSECIDRTGPTDYRDSHGMWPSNRLVVHLPALRLEWQ